MKIKIGKTSSDVKLQDDLGQDLLKTLSVSELSINVRPQAKTTATITMELYPSTVYASLSAVTYQCGKYKDIVGLVLADGTIVDLPEKNAEIIR